VTGNAFFDGQTTVSTASPTTPFSVDLTGTDGDVINILNDGVFAGSISVAGTTVSYNAFTGSHFAWTDEDLISGTLVSMTGDNEYLHDDTQSEILYGISKSTKKNDPAVLGTYLSRHHSSLLPEGSNIHLIMAEGNGDVWVADMGQDIKPGDYLISSAVPGHAMVDDRSQELSHIIGRAAEPVVWSEVSETIDGVKHKKISILFNFVPLYNNIAE